MAMVNSAKHNRSKMYCYITCNSSPNYNIGEARVDRDWSEGGEKESQ